jgi:DNA-binding MarR family transcriptional regulator
VLQEITAADENQVMTVPFTDLQGQYLAYIATYTKLHRRAPAEADIQQYFGVTPPTVHRMIVVLTERGLIRRRPGEPRSIEILISPDQLPPLR